jgi:hypothetical protein
MQYTVVGVYPDEFSDSRPIAREIDVGPATYVEWVDAASVEQAKIMAQEIDTDRAEAIVVAVFEGHHIDRLFNKGTERKD